MNREYKGGILLKEGEPAVVAGMITKSDQKSLSGLPVFSNIPGLGVLTSQRSKQEENDELLILITPYVVRSPERAKRRKSGWENRSGHRVIGSSGDLKPEIQELLTFDDPIVRFISGSPRSPQSSSTDRRARRRVRYVH